MFAKVYLEITDVCNLACSFCVGTTRPKHFLSVEEFDTLARRIRPHTDFLYFHVMGEPLLHPKLSTLLEHAHSFGFRVILTTNGTLLSQKADILLNAPTLFKVSISLHALEANSDLDFDSYLNGCFDFADRASRRGIISVFRLWNEGGQNTYNVPILEALRRRFDGEWADNTKGVRIRKKLFIENGERFEWPLHAQTPCEHISCFALKDHAAVLCDGTVIPCCMDYDGQLALGNLFEQTLEEILTLPQAQAFRASLDKGVAPCESCRRCGFAQMRFGAHKSAANQSVFLNTIV